MKPAQDGLFVGRVIHHRLRPRTHRLSYRHFMMLVDIDMLGRLSERLRLFTHNRAGIFSIRDRDYGAGVVGGLRAHVEAQLAAAGISPDGGPIRLLTIPRVLGYAFNPLSIYFCHRRDGTLAALLYEVNNTFGQRHSYLIPAAEEDDGTVRQSCAKRFYVSPFLDMDLAYRFRVHLPEQSVRIAVGVHDGSGPLLTAIFAGTHTPLTDAALARLLVLFPLQTFKVVAGIHVEAIRIWLKGIGLRERPAPPRAAVTISPVSSIEGIPRA
ncbi:DUF1365 domain-containing protein [Ancylobacter terrae]|uniref:DUF1365 domain-containing protein n=1 Tax=Ancylobacter sp. sgz301288 TaxID=3342077 RepID=UPI00385DBBC9